MKKHTLLLACAMRILLNLTALLEGGGFCDGQRRPASLCRLPEPFRIQTFY